MIDVQLELTDVRNITTYLLLRKPYDFYFMFEKDKRFIEIILSQLKNDCSYFYITVDFKVLKDS